MLTSILFWVAVILVLVAAGIGVAYLTRGTAVKHVRGFGPDGAPIPPSHPSFPLSVGLLTGSALLPGTCLELALNGDGTFPRLWEDLRSAGRTVTIQLYFMNPGGVADTLRDILVERAAAGVRIYFLYDAFGSNTVPGSYWEDLRRAGVAAVPFRPIRLGTLYTAQNRSHVRGIVVDGRVGWTGGFGIDDQWLGDGHTDGAWRDTNVRFRGPAVRQLQAAFADAWAEATGSIVTGPVTVEMCEDDSVAAAGLLHTAPTIGSTAAERFLAVSIASAERTLYVTNAYFAPDVNFVALLCEAARRGVDVRVLAAGPRTDVRMARLAARARYETLLRDGVRVWEYQPSSLHAKTLVADGLWCSIGSMNFDNRSLALNDEATLMVLDPAVGERMQAIFHDDLRRAEEIRLEQFRQRPWTGRIAERGADLLTRLL